MPEGCSNEKFARSRRTRMSDLTKMLDMAFYDPTKLTQNANAYNALRNPDALSQPSVHIKGWLESNLNKYGPPVDPDAHPPPPPSSIIANIQTHIQNWPDAGKEQLRTILVKFIEQTLTPPYSVVFRWKIGIIENDIEYAAVDLDGNERGKMEPDGDVIGQLDHFKQQLGIDLALQVTFVNTIDQIRVEKETAETFVDV